jgi:hypothetical protein
MWNEVSIRDRMKGRRKREIGEQWESRGKQNLGEEKKVKKESFWQNY